MPSTRAPSPCTPSLSTPPRRAQSPGERRPAPGRPARTRVGVLVEGRYRGQAQPAGLVGALRRRGCAVRLLDPAVAVVDLTDPSWCDGLRVLVCRGRSQAVLALLATAAARGIRCINTPESIGGVLNKALSAAALAAAGVPVPPTYLGTPRDLAGIDGSGHPLILKPICGDNATGLRVVRSRRQLRSLAWPEEVALAQRFMPTDGTDLKLYGAGERVWAVRRPSPIDADGSPRPPAGPGTPLPVDAGLAELARRCRQVSGLDLFGVDCALGPDGPVVLEVNDYPNYTGVGGVDDQLADLVLARVEV
jgi:ribosomal protein S6--L-glutamate ligase